MYKTISIILACIFCTGCSGILTLPPLLEMAGWVKTGADVISYAGTDKTTTDHALSYVTGKDCNTLNVLKDKPICQYENMVLVEKMIDMNCHTYSFTHAHRPYCKPDINEEFYSWHRMQ